MILDTSFVIDLFRGDKNAISKGIELDTDSEVLFTTSVTIFELWQGLGGKTENNRKMLEQFIDNFGMLQLDPESAKIAGNIHAELKSKGSSIDAGDSMIAGIALNNNQTILTRDEHFSRIKGLKVEAY